jgi:ComF family protein
MSRGTRHVAQLLDWLLDLVGPRTCVQCGAPCRGFACQVCARQLPSAAPSPGRIRNTVVLAAAGYVPPVSTAVRCLKYQKRAELARPLAELLHPLLVPALARRDFVVVPVPLHPTRLAQRGYNQAALVGRQVARFTGARFAPLALARRWDTPPLVGKSREARASTVRGAFRVRCPHLVRQGPCVVVDDVVTTGSTAAACIDALHAAGATVAAVVAVARAGNRSPPHPVSCQSRSVDPLEYPEEGVGRDEIRAAYGFPPP